MRIEVDHNVYTRAGESFPYQVVRFIHPATGDCIVTLEIKAGEALPPDMRLGDVVEWVARCLAAGAEMGSG